MVLGPVEERPYPKLGMSRRTAIHWLQHPALDPVFLGVHPGRGGHFTVLCVAQDRTVCSIHTVAQSIPKYRTLSSMSYSMYQHQSITQQKLEAQARFSGFSRISNFSRAPLLLLLPPPPLFSEQKVGSLSPSLALDRDYGQMEIGDDREKFAASCRRPEWY